MSKIADQRAAFDAWYNDPARKTYVHNECSAYSGWLAAKADAALQPVAISAAAPQVGAQEPERMDTDQSREYLVQFMRRHFTDKTFHRYILADEGRNGLAGDFAWQMARALRMLATPAQPVAAPDDFGVIEKLINVARCAYHAMDDTEENENGLMWSRDSFDALSGSVDALDRLPDDRPGYTMGPAAKAEWALRNSFPASQADVKAAS